jgi:mRNA-degrading endonuclease RelE of RelBE toxin-antitoxin system
VRLAKGWESDASIPNHEREAIFAKVLLLPAWADNQLEAANLDVRGLAGSDGFLRLRVGDYRVVFQRFDKAVVVHRIGHRSSVYDGLDSLVLVRSGDGLRVVDTRPPEEAPAPTPHRPEPHRPPSVEVVQNSLTPFTDAQLASAGLAAEQIAALRRAPESVRPDEMLVALGLEPRLIRLVLELWERPGEYVGHATLDDDLVRLDEEEAAARIASDLSSASLMSVSDMAAFAALLERPIEDWMVYLHPAQSRAVELSREGPVRVRGGAGTGKTVVALHRARRLAEETGGKILLTTFVTTLPKVWEGLFQTFAPEVRDRIEMRTVDSVGRTIYLQGGGHCDPVDDGHRRSVVAGLHASAKDRIGGLSAAELMEEFDVVLEGRGLSTLGEYLALPRTGRGSPLAASARRVVWELYERYRDKLESDAVVGWNAMRHEALAMLRDGRAHRHYDAVVVDEAQDLTEASIQLLAELAGGAPRPNLTVVGDGQQSIYPGGFSLRALGIDVRGRSTVLRTNWRNTYWIWTAAQAFISGEEFDDLEDEEALQREPEESPYPIRLGRPARLHLVDGGEDGEVEWIAELIAEDVANGADPGDCAALHPINRGAKKLESALRRADIPVEPLANYAGSHRDKVAAGTFHRAKGLEFKRVYVAGLAGGRWPLLFSRSDEQGKAEERARQVRAAFVAMTRARDTLDVVCGGRLPAELERARWVFEE